VTRNKRSGVLSASGLIAGFYLALAAGRAGADVDTVVVYPAFTGGTRAVIEGRVLEDRGPAAVGADDSWWRNLVRTLRALVSDEHVGATVNVRVGDGSWSTVTDAEGFFRLEAGFPHAPAPGWQRIDATFDNRRESGAMLVVPPGNDAGIISDIDDTILVSNVGHKPSLLANTFLLNPLQRRAVPGAAAAYRRLAARNAVPEAAPVFYLSASPRQLSASISQFLEHNEFPRGVLITKRVADGPGNEPLTDQGAYKSAHIEDIFTRLPRVRFTLIGDDGESDPEIYESIRRRFPARVTAIWIRRVSTDPSRARFAGQGNLADLFGPDVR
jgi:phosphatidate phosphatase APP1